MGLKEETTRQTASNNTTFSKVRLSASEIPMEREKEKKESIFGFGLTCQTSSRSGGGESNSSCLTDETGMKWAYLSNRSTMC